jgi:predicted esterase
LFQGVINFVGGWLGSGCRTSAEIHADLFGRGGAFAKPMLWLYGNNDSFYPLAHSRAGYDAFRAAGGKATFHEYHDIGELNGHLIIALQQAWTRDVDAYLASLGLR